MTLALSAGFFGFYSHAGFLAAFLDAGLHPAKITGTSAGAIIAALYGSGYSVEEMKSVLSKLQKEDFWDPSPGLGLLKGAKFEALLKEYLQDDFSQLRVPVFISTFDLKTLRTKVYSQNASVVKAVRASSALPVLFHPVRYENSILVDGGVADDCALKSVQKNEIVVGHYLLGGSKMNFIEQLRLKWHSSATRKMYVIEDRVRVSPNQLQQGPLAFEQAYEKANEYLSSEI